MISLIITAVVGFWVVLGAVCGIFSVVNACSDPFGDKAAAKAASVKAQEEDWYRR